MRTMILSAILAFAASSASAEVSVRIAYLEHQVKHPPTLSNLDPLPEDLGQAGAELGLVENQASGRFLGQAYTLSVRSVPPDEDFLAAGREVLSETRLLVVKAPAEELLALADLPEAAGALIFNSSAQDTRLRDADCRANLLHSIPSYAMRADALAQFMSKKRWSVWALVVGTHPGDLAFAEALRAAARKFGLRISDEKTWAFGADMRRNAAQEVPPFTQSLKAHDVLVVADEIGDFGRYLLYNTWLPRPVAGSEGVAPMAWSGAVEQWGAAQLQGRFYARTGRKMRAEDYAAWAAVRSIGEAVTRSGADEPDALRDYILSDAFELAGFKGRPLSYRQWNGQLRQPIPLVQPRALVAQAPLDGFLHQHTELDTLGLDAPECNCRAFLE
ncbi:ABC transporter substrate-binding protein [Pelagibius marinus]|uniref:ABC transporter substrate-binding protein n=1 Tax=Pelagibius marinus TaxID=2762760 RepID=UPI001872AD11|nr:ABC transporter substrate-binding protein [Pelagibius marinus]